MMYALQKMVRSVDTVIPFQTIWFISFLSMIRRLAKEIGERVQVKLTQGGYIPKGTDVQFKTYSYPKEAHQGRFPKRMPSALKRGLISFRLRGLRLNETRY